MKYVLNMELKKLCLETTKQEYQALTEEQKKAIKSNFLFSRRSGGWVSRCKWPNTGYAERVLKSIGAEDGGKVGDVMSFSEQMEQKAERAERRADRMEYRADKATAEGERLQAPINSMHGDIAFFTQPNINTSAGRAFTRRRNAMWESYERGFEEFKKSAYYKDRAEAARETYKNAKMPSLDFCQRRIEDAQKTIRAKKKQIATYESYLKSLEAGETPKDSYGWEVKISADKLTEYIERCEILLTEALEKEIYYREIQESQGGVQFSKDNIKPGYIVKVQHWGNVEVLSTGPKNFKWKSSSGNGISSAYAEVLEIAEERDPERTDNPFKVGDSFTVEMQEVEYWPDGRYKTSTFPPHVLKVVKASDKSVTLFDEKTNKKFVRKFKVWNHWNGQRMATVYPGGDYSGSINKVLS